MSDNLVTVAPGLTELVIKNDCILWKKIVKEDGYGYTKVKDELVVDYRLALDADLDRCLQAGSCAGHHGDDRSISLSAKRGVSHKEAKKRRAVKQTSCVSIEYSCPSTEYRLSRSTIYKINKGKTWQ